MKGANQRVYTCPLCKDTFKTPLKLGNHLKNDDIHHQFLKALIKLDKKKTIDFQEVFEAHKDLIMTITDLDVAIQDYTDALQRQKELEQQQKKEEKQRQQQLKQQERLSKLEEKKLAKLEKQKAEAERYKEIIEAKTFKKKHERKFVKQLEQEYKPLNLVKYFYGLVDIHEYNAIMATATIKSLYFKYQMTPQQIKQLLRYAAETGHSKISDAKFLIEESERFYQYAEQLKNPDTVPYLVKVFFNLKKMKIDKKLFVNFVDRIKNVMKSHNLTIEEASKIVEYMAKANVGSLFWFNEYINIVRPNKPIQEHFNDKQEIENNVTAVMKGEIRYSDINIRLSYSCFVQLKDKIMKGLFDDNYNYSEWLYKIQMTPDKELRIFINQHDMDRQSKFQKLLMTYPDDEDIRTSYQQYQRWCQQYRLGQENDDD